MKAWSPDRVHAALEGAGLAVARDEIRIEARSERSLVRLPGQRVAWFAASSSGVERLRNERRVLRILEAHCSFAVPRSLFVSPDGRFEVRTMVPGEADPVQLFAEIRNDAGVAARLGAALGAIFDHGEAAWADRHHDFCYLVLDVDRWDLLDAAVAAYQRVSGQRILRARVLLYHAACAVSFLAFRSGRGPDERWCGRTLT